MMYATATRSGELMAEVARTYVGVPSVQHGRFHAGINPGERQEPKLIIDQRAEEHLRAGLTDRKLVDYLTHQYEVHRPHSAQTGLDCSGLANIVMLEALERIGFEATVPRHVKGFYIWALTVFVPNGSLEPGDLLFSHRSSHRTPPDHIGIYDGRGRVVTSPGVEERKVQIVSIEHFCNGYGGLVAAKRLQL